MVIPIQSKEAEFTESTVKPELVGVKEETKITTSLQLNQHNGEKVEINGHNIEINHYYGSHEEKEKTTEKKPEVDLEQLARVYQFEDKTLKNLFDTAIRYAKEGKPYINLEAFMDVAEDKGFEQASEVIRKFKDDFNHTEEGGQKLHVKWLPHLLEFLGNWSDLDQDPDNVSLRAENTVTGKRFQVEAKLSNPDDVFFSNVFRGDRDRKANSLSFLDAIPALSFLRSIFGKREYSNQEVEISRLVHSIVENLDSDLLNITGEHSDAKIFVE